MPNLLPPNWCVKGVSVRDFCQPSPSSPAEICLHLTVDFYSALFPKQSSIQLISLPSSSLLLCLLYLFLYSVSHPTSLSFLFRLPSLSFTLIFHFVLLQSSFSSSTTPHSCHLTTSLFHLTLSSLCPQPASKPVVSCLCLPTL